jgi:indolepyruvate ferredoxin oxidoreductase beta subunit
VRRGVTYLKEGGLAIVNSRVTAPVEVISGLVPYPDMGKMMALLGKVTDRIKSFDATSIAEEAGDPITTNIVILGALTQSGVLPYGEDVMVKTIKAGIRPQFIDLNMKAFNLGKNAYNDL